MRIFKNLNEMYQETERELLHNGLISQSSTVQDLDVRENDDYKMKELVGYSFLVKDTSERDEWLLSLGKNLDWAKEEFKERISGVTNPGLAWKLRSEYWEKFLHNGLMSYTYPERMTGKVQHVVELIQKNPNTRQATISIYNSILDDPKRGGFQRVPCSMFYQFMPRDGRLTVVYLMRSNDFYEHFPYDIWLASELKSHVAEKASMLDGDLIYFSSSLHCFKKDKREIF